MRTALTLARLHGEETFQVLAGQDVAIDQQHRDVKTIASGGREHPDFAEVQLWTSDSGMARKLRFSEPAPAEESDEQPNEQTPTGDNEESKDETPAEEDSAEEQASAPTKKRKKD